MSSHVGHIFGGTAEWYTFKRLVVLELRVYRGIPLGERTEAIIGIHGLWDGSRVWLKEEPFCYYTKTSHVGIPLYRNIQHTKVSSKGIH